MKVENGSPQLHHKLKLLTIPTSSNVRKDRKSNYDENYDDGNHHM